jgi:hypothetical protein
VGAGGAPELNASRRDAFLFLYEIGVSSIVEGVASLVTAYPNPKSPAIATTSILPLITNFAQLLVA